MFGLGMPELVVVFLIVLVVFGAGKIPQIGEGIGKAIRGFNKALSEPPEQLEEPKKKENQIGPKG